MQVSDLARHVSQRGSYFFTRKTMRFFGDRMCNYRVVGPLTIVTPIGDTREVWEVQRKRPVKHGLQASAYFDIWTFDQAIPNKDLGPVSIHWGLMMHARYLGITDRWQSNMYHWQVTLTCGRRKLTCDYFQGLAHATDGKPNAPTLASVLYSLQIDARCGEQSYADYVSDFGDSSPETWRACIRQYRELGRLLSTDLESFLRAEIE